MVVRPAQSDTAEAEKPLTNNSHSLFGDPNFSIRPQETLSTGQMFLKMMLAVVFIVALGAGAIYFSRKWLPKITNLPGKKIRIIETVHIGPRKEVHLLKVGEQFILIGSTNENISKLADITDDLSDMDLSSQKASGD